MNDPPFIGFWYMERKLGEGGFGIVSLWKNKKTNKEVAIKKYNLPNEKNEVSLKDRERCFKEVNYMTDILQHENIVKGYKMDSDFIKTLTKNNPQGLPVLVMEYCEKGDLRRELNNLANTNGLPEMEVRNVLKSLRNAISYLHQHGITHRDIKPENIVIKSNNGQNIYKITDLGYARNISSTVDASLVGTIEYVAPELFQSTEYSRTVDYWSMGIIGFEIICGFRPFVPNQSMVQRFVLLKNKTSIHIAITENNFEKITYHKTLFNESRLSKCFKQLMEKWLILPLEKDPKQRGSVFEKQENTGTDEVSVPVAPVKVLKIYTQLDEILDKNILTIFSLVNYEFLSCIITPETTLDELVSLISTSFHIPAEELYIIPTLEQTIVTHIDQQTKPIDLFIKDFYDYPMIYVTRRGNYIEGVIKPYFPEIVKDALQAAPSVQYKFFVQIELIRNIIYFLRNEQRLYSTFLYGLKNYSMYLNDEIDKFRANVDRMYSSNMRLLGKTDFYQETVDLSKDKLDEKNKTQQYQKQIANWDKECALFKEKSFKMFDACNTIERRHKSILRRSNESLKNNLAENYDKKIFNITAFENLYRECKARKRPHEQKTIIKTLLEAIKERDRILKSREFLDVQICLKEIHIEYKAIAATMTKALSAIEQLNSELLNANKSHHEQFWNIYEEISRRPLSPVPSSSLTQTSDITSIMENLSILNGARLSPRSLKDITSMEISCYGEGNDTKSLIDENNQIIAAFADLVKDVTNEQGSPEINS